MIECSPNLACWTTMQPHTQKVIKFGSRVSHGEKLLISWYSQIRKAKLLTRTLQTAALHLLSLTCMKFGTHMYHSPTYKKIS